MRLRYTLLLFALDIEHFEKVKLLKKISESTDDGYNIVNAYLCSLQQIEETNQTGYKPYSSLMSEINRNRTSEYCGGIITKYDGHYPAWAFVEVISFGSFISFLKYCADFFHDKNLEDDYYLLRDVKRLRNVTAHNNCVIYNLSLNTAQHKANYNVNRYLSSELHISKDVRDRRMSNAAIRDIITLLYTHKRIVTSQGVYNAKAKELHNTVERCFKHIDYYKDNVVIIATFNFLKKVIDKMYDVVV